MKIIKQKCLDALTNILCVPVIEEYVLKVLIVDPYKIGIKFYFRKSHGFYETLLN